MSDQSVAERAPGGAGEVFAVFLRLGLTSFGGPIAHLGYFHEAFVARRRWLSESAYADLVALCQFLPGPASSQVGLAIGLMRGGWLGGLAAWAAFTLPSAILMAAFAYGVVAAGDLSGAGWLAGLKAAAAAVVAQALLGMSRALCPDALRASLAVAAAALALAAPGALGQLGAIGLGAAIGLALLRQQAAFAESEPLIGWLSPRVGAVALAIFFALLAALPLAVEASGSLGLAYFDAFYRSGALVFGGGHVVLPLLQAETVETGWIAADRFLAGYGAAQAVPGPLFSFAAYLGAAMEAPPNGVLGAVLCLVAIYVPSSLLVIGAMPFWSRLRAHMTARAALAGVNAAVVGLLLAAFYDPVFLSAVAGSSLGGAAAVSLAAAAFVALELWKTPPWAVVAGAALVGEALARVGEMLG